MRVIPFIPLMLAGFTLHLAPCETLQLEAGSITPQALAIVGHHIGCDGLDSPAYGGAVIDPSGTSRMSLTVVAGSGAVRHFYLRLTPNGQGGWLDDQGHGGTVSP